MKSENIKLRDGIIDVTRVFVFTRTDRCLTCRLLELLLNADYALSLRYSS